MSSPQGQDSHILGNHSCTHTGSCIHTGNGTGMGNRRGRCLWRDVRSLQDVQSLPRAGKRGGLPDVLLGVCRCMGSGKGSRGVGRGTVHNARGIRDVHTLGSRNHWLGLKPKLKIVNKTLNPFPLSCDGCFAKKGCQRRQQNLEKEAGTCLTQYFSQC